MQRMIQRFAIKTFLWRGLTCGIRQSRIFVKCEIVRHLCATCAQSKQQYALATPTVNLRVRKRKESLGDSVQLVWAIEVYVRIVVGVRLSKTLRHATTYIYIRRRYVPVQCIRLATHIYKPTPLMATYVFLRCSRGSNGMRSNIRTRSVYIETRLINLVRVESVPGKVLHQTCARKHS
jgi:hypothetical protein